MNVRIIPRTNSSVSQRKLVILGERALRVLERHGATSPALAAISTLFTPTATEFLEVHARIRSNRQIQALRLAAGRRAASALIAILRSWIGALAADVPDFDPSAYRMSARSPDLVIVTGKQILDVVDTYEAERGEPLPYAEALKAEVNGALTLATAEWTRAQDTLVANREAMSRLRVLGAELQRKLVALRRTLRETLGRTHPDYAKLRASRASSPDEDDPATDEGEAEAGEAEAVVEVASDGAVEAAE